ncbi:PD-(D/E)XK nuclease family protein [Mycolicibacterium sp. lyk4-40-TYG-92]|uniref:PD-(D/E)XK nuclease family protein n=1 Tax=Mycolicibacterium sp. lyk4-40-TYG-92 TaxID=3040295 RepID=UPI003306263C
MFESPHPHPNRIDRITPTVMNALRTCFWRVGFGRDTSASSLRRSSPRASLGTVVHSVKRQFGDPRGFEEVWDAEVAIQQARLCAEWAPAIPPSPDNWPGWSLTKTRIGKAWQRFGPSPVVQQKSRGGGGLLPPLPWRERLLEHPTLPLRGEPDLVDRVDGKLWVIDTKTGLHQEEPTVEQRDQLLFYCALVDATLGEAPVTAAIETSRGERHSFQVDPDEVNNIVQQALDVLARFNAAAASEFSENLASPSAQNCGWCPFRPACGPFFQAYDETWEIPHAVLFTVSSANGSKLGLEVEGVVQLPRWRANRRVISLGLPFPSPPSEGETWGATDYVGRGDSAVAAWNTTTYRWP